MYLMDTTDPFLLPTPKSSLAGVSEYRGCPVYRRTSGGWRSALFVVAVEITGSFAYFGISANLITYLTGPLGHSNTSAAATVNAWSGTASLMPLLGAFLANAYLGRYCSIIIACSLYVPGYGMLTLSTTLPGLSPTCIDGNKSENFKDIFLRRCRKPGWAQLGFFYVSLYLIAVAQGADKLCWLAFAADQFDAEHPKERASRGSLFNRWFFCMAMGISVAVSVVGYIQDNLGWGLGFGIPCGVVLAAFTVFLLGTPTYRLYSSTTDTSESPFLRLARSIFLRGGDKDTDDDEACSASAASVARLLPIWATSLAYGVVYAQIMTLFNKQGRTLDRRICIGGIWGGIGWELPPAALQALGPTSILVFVPIYDRALVPALRWATGHPSELSMLQRVGAGMAMSLAVPHALRSLGLALYLSIMGIGGLISSALISLIDAITSSSTTGDSWFADNLNRAHLDYFYCLLAGISALELALFLFFARTYVYNYNERYYYTISSSSSANPK